MDVTRDDSLHALRDAAYRALEAREEQRIADRKRARQELNAWVEAQAESIVKAALGGVRITNVGPYDGRFDAALVQLEHDIELCVAPLIRGDGAALRRIHRPHEQDVVRVSSPITSLADLGEVLASEDRCDIVATPGITDPIEALAAARGAQEQPAASSEPATLATLATLEPELVRRVAASGMWLPDGLSDEELMARAETALRFATAVLSLAEHVTPAQVAVVDDGSEIA